MALAVMDVLDAAETARRAGSIGLCAELLQLAEQMITDVDHAGTALSRLAVQEIANRMPIGAIVGDACWRASADELRYALMGRATG